MQVDDDELLPRFNHTELSSQKTSKGFFYARFKLCDHATVHQVLHEHDRMLLRTEIIWIILL